MNTQLGRILAPLFSGVTLVALACTCSGLGVTSTPTDVPLPPPDTQPPPTKAPIVAPTQPQVVEAPTDVSAFTGGFDDFSSDYGGWEVFDGAAIADGVFYLGEFADCADVGSDNPFGCFTQCLVCGTLSVYDMQVDAQYVSGVTDRTFGMVLRFVDFDNNGLVDPGDYYLDFELSIYDQYFVSWEHMPNGGWTRVFDAFDSNIRGGGKVNTLRAVAQNGGADIDFYINGGYANGVTGVPYTEGTVGLLVGGRALQVAFDNFDITVP